mgnify:FL=1|jgi:adenine phosphoribosyltransferase|tara:strand:- start:6346 stop:6927 length:582 start_codon:yes stop_codon:yes gene_type:complete
MQDAIQRLSASLKEAPVVWKGDYAYFVHPLTDGVPRLEADVFQAVIDLVYDSVDWNNIDLLLGIEAMGLPLTSSLSLRTGLPQVVARKRSYGLDGEITIDQETGYSKGSMYLNDIKPGESIAIVDDVLSTGGTLDAVIKGVVRAGATVSTIVTVVEKGPGLEMLREKYPSIDISSIVRLTMNGAEIILLDEVV